MKENKLKKSFADIANYFYTLVSTIYIVQFELSHFKA